ncbi:hypothetical protein AAVH_41331, partial [Aphelenchoides avenae]
MRHLDVRKAHRWIDTSVSSVSLLLNGYLFYLIMTRSSFKIKAFKWIFLLTCVSDFVLAAVVLIGQPAIFMDNGYMILIVNGFFAHRNEFFDRVCLSMYCACLHTDIICVVVAFVLRYRLLKKQDKLKKSSVFIKVWPVIWCTLQAATAFWCFAVADDPLSKRVAIDYLRKVGFEYDSTESPHPSSTHLTEVRTQIHHVMYLVSTIGGYAIIVWSQVSIFSYLRRHGAAMHERTRKAHAAANRALTVL